MGDLDIDQVDPDDEAAASLDEDLEADEATADDVAGGAGRVVQGGGGGTGVV